MGWPGCTSRPGRRGGTRWAGGIQQAEGIAVFGADLPFVISCRGPEDDKRFSIDVVRWNRIGASVIEYLDLYLDVMIGAGGTVTEKDEHQLGALDPPEKAPRGQERGTASS